MRSASELKFRIRQEVANVVLLLRQPQFRGTQPESLTLPDVAAIVNDLQSSQYAESILDLAQKIVRHEFPILGIEIQTGPDIQWRRDYLHHRESQLLYFKRLPYLNFEAVGDHKVIWELNRHQHLVVLAQAFRFDGNPQYLEELRRQLQSWFAQNPFQRGINWTSALEVAFRALSWIWIYHFVGQELDETTRALLLNGIYQHGLHLAENLSVYFSPNTHLLGEAVALFVIAALFPAFPRAGEWKLRSNQIVVDQLSFQVQTDGSHFEQSTYYHGYALDFFLLFYIVAGRPENIGAVVDKMATYLQWLLGPNREIQFFGDDDGGRLFHPYGRRSQFGRATLATCAILFGRPEWAGLDQDIAEQAVWWIGAESRKNAVAKACTASGSKLFVDSGGLFIGAGDFWLQFDCGPFGFGGAGHSHSDTLSITLLYGGEPVLIDPGTFTYISDIAQRNWFRGSGAHSTVVVNSFDQADPVGPFRWSGKPLVKLERFDRTDEGWLVKAYCEHHTIRHTRTLLLNERGLLVLDEVKAVEDTGAEAGYFCEQGWQLGPKADALSFWASSSIDVQDSFFSPAYGLKLPSVRKVVAVRGELPIYISAQFSVDQIQEKTVEEVQLFFGRYDSTVNNSRALKS